jgi:hypothetical protein
VHLKLLGAFHKLHEEIAGSNGLFGYADFVQDMRKDKASIDWQKKTRETRWEVYVVRAVARFTAWWRVLPRTGYGAPLDVLSGYNRADRVGSAQMDRGLDGRFNHSVDSMPPLGV